MTRPVCKIDGCNNLAAKKKKRKDGSQAYRKSCNAHHKKKYNMSLCGKDKRTTGVRKMISRSSCFICGWDKAECDAHRIVYGCNGGKYVVGNVVAVCPNCHRLIHRGKVEIS